jgi:hypothetical protein
MPVSEFTFNAAYSDLGGTRPISWGVRWRPDDAWAFSLNQQFDLLSEEWFSHRGSVVRYFHRFALEAALSHDPRQRETAVTLNIVPLFSDDHDPFFDPATQWELQ